MTTELSLSQKLKYYGPNDMATFLNISDVIGFISDFSPEKEYNVNDILALQNCIKYLDNQNFINNLTDDQKTTCLNKKSSIKRSVGCYWVKIDHKTFRDLIINVDNGFFDDLIVSIITYKVNDRLSKEELMELLDANEVPLYVSLKNNNLVNELDDELRERLVHETIAGAECIISAKLLSRKRDKIYLPKSLTNEDIDAIINRYLDDERANYNYVQIIMRANPDAGISDETRLKAKRLYDRQTEEFFKHQNGVQYGIEVKFSKGQDEPLEITRQGNMISYSISEKYLNDRLDYESIVTNFASIFGMAEPGNILTLPSYPAEMSTLEKILTVRGRNDYMVGHAFMMKDARLLYTVALYDQYLKSKNIDIEAVIHWFFSDYLKDIFGTPGFSFTPSSSVSYYEKAKNLFTEMEGVMRQIKMFFENGSIDDELLSMSSRPIVYGDICSLNKNKYVRLNQDNDEIVNIMHCIFSDQSMLHYINVELREDNLMQLILRHDVTLGNFLEYQRPHIKYLTEIGILSLDNNGHVGFCSAELIGLLNMLNRLEAVVYPRCTDIMRRCADSMIARGWLKFNNRLLTSQESDYFDYCLNKRQFSNGLDLRNKYLHGTQSRNQNENEHRSAYYRGIILVMALVIKIYDDLVIRECS